MNSVEILGFFGQIKHKGRGRQHIFRCLESITIGTDSCCSPKLPDDVKQNIEDAGARYIPYVTNLPDLTQHAC